MGLPVACATRCRRGVCKSRIHGVCKGPCRDVRSAGCSAAIVHQGAAVSYPDVNAGVAVWPGRDPTHAAKPTRDLPPSTLRLQPWRRCLGGGGCPLVSRPALRHCVGFSSDFLFFLFLYITRLPHGGVTAQARGRQGLPRPCTGVACDAPGGPWCAGDWTVAISILVGHPHHQECP